MLGAVRWGRVVGCVIFGSKDDTTVSCRHEQSGPHTGNLCLVSRREESHVADADEDIGSVLSALIDPFKSDVVEKVGFEDNRIRLGMVVSKATSPEGLLGRSTKIGSLVNCDDFRSRNHG